MNAQSRQRVLETVAHRKPETTPTFLIGVGYGTTNANLQMWLERFGAADNIDLRLKLGVDACKIEASAPREDVRYWTRWGTVSQWEGGYGEARGGHPLAGACSVQDIEDYDWPMVHDFKDYAKVKAGLENLTASTGFARITGLGWEPVFCTLLDLFGMEEAMVKFHTSPAVIEAAVAHIERYLLEGMEALLAATRGLADFFWYGDDFSTQRGLMISPEHWRRYLKPTYRKVFAKAKSAGLRVWFHSCGTFRPIMPDLIDIGIDVWETVQAHLRGNEPEALKRDYGSHITFCGGVNTQGTLTFGTPRQVRAEVRERIRVLGVTGGYICGPDHSLLPNMPKENIAALFEEARRS